MYHVVKEMEEMSALGKDCWIGRVDKIFKLLDLPIFESHVSPNIVGNKCKYQLENKYQTFYLSEINQTKLLNNDGQNHNKLRFYSSIKGCFKPEWYVTNIHNRNHRSEIS